MEPLFAHTFVVNNGRDQPTLRVVAPDEAGMRKKRAHRKSRLGCIRCKRRKVKCDEADPCGHCVKRGEPCVRVRHPSRDQLSPSLPKEMDWSPLSAAADPEGVPVNLLHMELLHHFERVTVPTLIFANLWPRMLQLAFTSQQHTFLVNAMLSLAAAHLEYLVPDHPRYHRAKYALLDKALHDYRAALSEPITSSNCDPLLGGAVLVHYLLWSDLSFLDNQPGELDLSSDRLYHLSTGQRQIFFMAWRLFQREGSVFRHVPVLQPCMTLSDEVEARGLNWRRYARGFARLYDNPRYQTSTSQPSSTTSTSTATSLSPSPSPTTPLPVDPPDTPPFYCPTLPALRVLTLWESYKEGEAYVSSGGTPHPLSTRKAYTRLAERVSIAMVFLDDCPPGNLTSRLEPDPDRFQSQHVVRHVLTFAMLCFGPLLPLISTGDSRVLVLLLHMYRTTGRLLPGERFWWCKRRVDVMGRVVGEELKRRGVEVCLRGGELI